MDDPVALANYVASLVLAELSELARTSNNEGERPTAGGSRRSITGQLQPVLEGRPVAQAVMAAAAASPGDEDLAAALRWQLRELFASNTKLRQDMTESLGIAKRWITPVPTELLGSSDAAAVRVAALGRWSTLEQQGPIQGRRMPVRFVGSPVDAPVDGWVDIEHIAPLVASPVAAVRQPAAVERWLANYRVTNLWSGPEPSAGWLLMLPQFSELRQLADQLGDRIQVYYYGNSLALPTTGWADAVDLGPIPRPATVPPKESDWTTPPILSGPWLRTASATGLWSQSQGGIQFSWIPPRCSLQQVAQQQQARIPISFSGNKTTQAGVAWVDAKDVGPIPPPSPPIIQPDFPVTEDLADKVVAYGKTLIGIPYCFGAKTPNGPSLSGDNCHGIDCSGFVCEVLEHCGIRLGDRNYLSADAIRQKVRRIDERDARSADLVFFHTTYGSYGRNYSTHIAFWLDSDHMLAAGEDGVKVYDLNTPYWNTHWLSMGRAF